MMYYDIFVDRIKNYMEPQKDCFSNFPNLQRLVCHSFASTRNKKRDPIGFVVQDHQLLQLPSIFRNAREKQLRAIGFVHLFEIIGRKLLRLPLFQQQQWEGLVFVGNFLKSQATN